MKKLTKILGAGLLSLALTNCATLSKADSLDNAIAKYLDKNNLPKLEYLERRGLYMYPDSFGGGVTFYAETYNFDGQSFICGYPTMQQSFPTSDGGQVVPIGLKPRTYIYQGNLYIDEKQDGFNGNEELKSDGVEAILYQ